MPPLPEPLHPAVVHLPIALAALMPLFVLFAMAARRAGFPPARLWGLVFVLQVLVFAGAWTASRTGEAEKERVERVAGEPAVEKHEEAAERATLLAGVMTGVMLLGFLPGGAGRAGRAAALVGSIALLATIALAASHGGDLVWKRGAASAYVPAAGAPPVDRTGPRR